MSLTAKELRIGNYIYCKGGIIKVTLIGYYGVQSSINGTTINAKFNTPDLEPIPLTEQWLMDLGFEDSKEYPLSKVKGVFRCNYGNRATWTYCNVPIPDIKHVHQLQNLYHALTGEELKTK